VFCVDNPRHAAGACWAALNGVLVLMGHPMRRRIVGTDTETMFKATLDLMIEGLKGTGPNKEVNS